MPNWGMSVFTLIATADDGTGKHSSTKKHRLKAKRPNGHWYRSEILIGLVKTPVVFTAD